MVTASDTSPMPRAITATWAVVATEIVRAFGAATITVRGTRVVAPNAGSDVVAVPKQDANRAVAQVAAAVSVRRTSTALVVMAMVVVANAAKSGLAVAAVDARNPAVARDPVVRLADATPVVGLLVVAATAGAASAASARSADLAAD